MSYYVQPDVNKEFILDNLSQEQIMEFYLGVPIKPGRKFSSPFRKDRHPSCSMTYRNGKLIFSDFATKMRGGCFDVVMERFHLNFQEALEKIAFDFNLVSGRPVPKKEYPEWEHERIHGSPEAEIQIKRRPWSKVDAKFWKDRYGITRKELDKFQVIPIRNAWINGRMVYNFKEHDPGYAYHIRKGKYKIYLPLRDRSRTRFYHNTRIFQGFYQLPPSGEFLVITKSMKDVLLLDQFNVPAIAPPSETVYLKDELVDHLKNRFKHIYSLYDFDRGGVPIARYLRDNFNIPPLMLTDGNFNSKVNYQAKDLSDFRWMFGEALTQRLVKETKTVIQHEIDNRSAQIPYYT